MIEARYVGIARNNVASRSRAADEIAAAATTLANYAAEVSRRLGAGKMDYFARALESGDYYVIPQGSSNGAKLPPGTTLLTDSIKSSEADASLGPRERRERIRELAARMPKLPKGVELDTTTCTARAQR